MAKLSTTNQSAAEAYPIRFSVEYPEQGLSRVKTFFRIFLLIPIYLVWLALENIAAMYIGTSLSISIATLLMLVFRRKYPRWWFDFQVELVRFLCRIFIYFSLMRDEYPSTDEQQAVKLKIDYPNADELNQFLPLVKWILAIPHYFVLIILSIISVFALIFAWFAILFTARYPKFIFDYIEGVSRWELRIYGYAFLLVTDKYPPFSLK